MQNMQGGACTLVELFEQCQVYSVEPCYLFISCDIQFTFCPAGEDSKGTCSKHYWVMRP